MAWLERLLRIIALLTYIARIAIPNIWQVVLLALKLVFVAVIAMWAGVPGAINEIALEWRDRATDAGFPTKYDRELYWFMWGLGLLSVLVGWVILSYITVFIVRLIF